MIKAVFLDVANTLLHKPDLLPSIQEAFRQNGLPLSIDDIRSKHKTLSETITFPDTTTKEFYNDFNKELCYSLGIIPDDKLLEGIYDQCSNLGWKAFDDCDFLNQIVIPLGIASNWDISLKDKLIEFLPVKFMWIVGSANSGFKKPEMSFFEEIVNVSGLAADEIIFVGDSLKLDIEPAMNIGMKALLIDRSNSFVMSNAEKISNLGEIEKWL